MSIRSVWRLGAETFREWMTDGASQLAAGIAFYTIFSLAPILIILVAMSGLLYGEEGARARIVERAEDLAGPQVSQIVETVLRDAHAASGTATVLGVIALLFGATVVFTSLQEALNTIWAVAPKPGGHAWRYVRKRIVSFVIVLLLGVVLLFSMMAGTAVASITAAANGVVQMSSRYLSLLDTLAWFVVLTLCFAVIYKFLPDVKIAWSDVWVGSAAAALLFSIGRLLFARFLTHSAIASTFGAASSLVVFLLWVYYSAQIVLLCAEFTHIYAKRYGSGIHPDESSMRVFKRYRSA